MRLIYILSFLGSCLAESLNLNNFPQGFLFGFATASYQIEGGWNENGKGENIWDRYSHLEPSKIWDKSNGDVACDSLHKYEEDVQMLKDAGAQVYRFSLSWSRILPQGDISNINSAGLNYYNNLINELVASNIQPMVTLYHWDLPQTLQDLGGWPNPIMVNYFEDYARLAFQTFGDRVKWWITFNEPLEVCRRGYGDVVEAPGLNMSGIADYLCTHTILKAHAKIYRLYKNDFDITQGGKIGMALNGGWYEPLTDSLQDIKAAEKSLEFEIGWFLHPILGEGGDYPPIMRKVVDANSRDENRVKSRLPYFDKFWKECVQGTLDFLGVNHYTTFLVTPGNFSCESTSFARDMGASVTQSSSWPSSYSPWLKVEPTGFRKKLNWLKNYTNNFPIFITENGYSDDGKLCDIERINYYKLHLTQLLKAINEDKCNVLGYIAWSLMDNFEWTQGYGAKFGIYNVNFDSPERTRTAKSSVNFFKELIQTGQFSSKLLTERPC